MVATPLTPDALRKEISEKHRDQLITVTNNALLRSNQINNIQIGLSSLLFGVPEEDVPGVTALARHELHIIYGPHWDVSRLGDNDQMVWTFTRRSIDSR